MYIILYHVYINIILDILILFMGNNIIMDVYSHCQWVYLLYLFFDLVLIIVDYYILFIRIVLLCRHLHTQYLQYKNYLISAMGIFRRILLMLCNYLVQILYLMNSMIIFYILQILLHKDFLNIEHLL